MRSAGQAAGNAGYTLAELLVVIAIIAILAGLSVVGIQKAQEYSHTSAERHTISMLKVGINTFSQELGDAPPTSLRSFDLRSINRINEGNESLFACLETRKKNGPFIEGLDEERWENTDGDTLTSSDLKKVVKGLDWARPGNRLLEYTDFWGNPYVYIHSANYGEKQQYQDGQGRIFEVEAARNPRTGGYAAPGSYQLWSLGPDGENQNGAGDDICSWKS